jgi:hypothetical protein
MPTQATVLTPWAGKGTESEPYAPQLPQDYKIKGWKDITQQTAQQLIPAFGLYLIEICADEEVIDQIDKDTRYCIVWAD